MSEQLSHPTGSAREQNSFQEAESSSLTGVIYPTALLAAAQTGIGSRDVPQTQESGSPHAPIPISQHKTHLTRVPWDPWMDLGCSTRQAGGRGGRAAAPELQKGRRMKGGG